nr:hypothetical protein [Butyrivibrio sp.]
MADIIALDCSNLEESIKPDYMKESWKELKLAAENGNFTNDLAKNIFNGNENNNIEIYIENARYKISNIMGVSLKADTKTKEQQIDSKALQSFIDSLYVTRKTLGRTETKSYKEIYKIPNVTINNRDAIMAHLFYNFTVGDYANEFLNGNMTVKLDKKAIDYDIKNDSNPNKSTVYITPFVPGLSAAQETIENAESIKKPKMNGFKAFVGRIFRKFGMKSGWAKEVAEYDSKVAEWNKARELPKEREIVKKYNNIIKGLSNEEEDNYIEHSSYYKSETKHEEIKQTTNDRENEFYDTLKLI